MSKTRPTDRRHQLHSLHSVVLLHNAAFLVLIAVTGMLGIAGTWFWQQSSTESLRLNTLLNEALQTRGDIFREIKEISTARLTNDPTALDQYWRHLYQIDQHFHRLEKAAIHDGEQTAVKTMRHSFEIMQSEMNKLFSLDGAGYQAYRKMADDVYQQQILGDFENAFNKLGQRISERQRQLESRMDDWTQRVPFIVAQPILLALALLVYSRRKFHQRFILPMNDVAAGAQRISTGELTDRIPVRGVEEVASLADAMNHMAAELSANRQALVESERQAALGALVPVVAHNIRNPLASIRATAQVLEYAEDNRELLSSREAIIDTVDRLERWVNALLCYLNPLKPAKTITAIQTIADQAIAALDIRLEEKRLSIKRSNWNTAAEIPSDKDLLEQAIYGLLNNAIEASPEAGAIHLSMESSQDDVILQIDDTGPGMPFKPIPTGLSPGPSTKRFGTGLGIPFAFKIVKAHGGRLLFGAAPPGGTRVSLIMPFAATTEQ